MSMNSPLMQLADADVQATVNSYIPGTGLAWSSLFPLKYTRKFDLKGIEGNEGIPVSADRVAFNTKAPLKTRKVVGTWSGTLSKISVARSKDEIEINEYKDAQVLAASNADPAAATDLVNMVYDDYDFCNKAMDYRVELDSLRIATSGKQAHNVAYDGEEATANEINFNIPSSNFKGASVVWSNAAQANGLKDIIDAQEAIAATGAPKPMFAYMEKAQFAQLQSQASTAARLYPLAKANTLATITTEMVSLENINAFMDKNGYPHILILDSYVTIEAKDGSQTTIKPWNVNVVVLSATRQLGWTYYKTVPQVEGSKAIQAYGSYYKTTRYSEDDPMCETTKAEAYVQPALINRKSLVLINAANTSWNNGEA